MTPRPRKDNPVKHLDASVQHVEDALIARADEIDRGVKDASTLEKASLLTWLSGEFRALADELHYW